MEHTPESFVTREAAFIRRRVRSWWRQARAFHHMLSRFTPYLRKQRGSLSVALACALGYVLVSLLEPWPIKLILDNVLLGRPVPSLLSPALGNLSGSPVSLLFILVGAILVIAVFRGILYYYREVLTSLVGQQAVADIRQDLYSHIQRLSFSFHDRRRTGDLLSRLTSDIRILRNVLISLPVSLAGDIFLTLAMTVVMFVMDWRLTLIALTVFPCLALAVRAYQGPLKRAIRDQREREGNLANMASEALGAIKVVQGFTREQEEVRKFGSQNRRSLRSGLRAARLEARFNLASELVVGVGTAVILLVAVHRALSGALSPGDLLVFVLYLRTFYRPLRRISRVTERVARGTVSGERILEILETRSKVRNLAGSAPAPRLQGEIAFDGVYFGYRSKGYVLKDINLHIKPAEHVALVGLSGVGKTTLVSLIPRFYDPALGRVLIDGRDVREFTLESLRSQISMVFQEPALFATTIAENISHGKPGATKEEIVRAAELAGIHHIISALTEGYETEVGERGGTLSGGQRQCVAIARAIIRDPAIVILDEPTTGLDSESAGLVIQGLHRLTKGRTVITISHQLSTVRDADRIILLDNGQIVEEESASTLVPGNGTRSGLKALQPRELNS